jgi:hypothetical protein
MYTAIAMNGYVHPRSKHTPWEGDPDAYDPRDGRRYSSEIEDAWHEEWQSARNELLNWIDYKPQTIEDVNELADALRTATRDIDVTAGEEMRFGRIRHQLLSPEQKAQPDVGWMGVDTTGSLERAESALDRYESAKYDSDDPQDIQAWDRFRRDPKMMKSVTEIPGFRLKGVDPSVTEMTPKEEQDLHEAEALFASWRDHPGGMGGMHGVGLAKLFLGESGGPGAELEPNYEAARVLAESSAKAGGSFANNLMWKEFGVSEEWTPTSFVHDYTKAAQKATRMAKAELGLDLADFTKDNKALAKMGRAKNKAEKALDKWNKEYARSMVYQRRLRDKYDISDEGFDEAQKTYAEAFQKLVAYDELQHENYDKVAKPVTAARKAHEEKVELTRQGLHTSLAAANQQTVAPPEYRESISSGLDNRRFWRDRSKDQPERTPRGNISRKAQKEFDDMMHARDIARTKNPQAKLGNAEPIKAAINGVLGYVHRDLIEGTGLFQTLGWEVDALYRGNANERDNMIRLDEYASVRVAVHEFGHFLAFRNPNVNSRFVDFYEYKTEGVKPRRLPRHEKWEWFKIPRGKKAFFDDYAGHMYEIGGKQKDTELMSLGVDALEDKKQFYKLLTKDPEHLALVLASIRGY